MTQPNPFITGDFTRVPGWLEQVPHPTFIRANLQQVGAQDIGNAVIVAGMIALATITGDRIANATITAQQIGNATIVAANIANATITGAQIANATITGGNIAAATISAGNIVNATITATQIANATITATQIANATITAAQIAAGTITGGNIASGTIVAGNITALTITAGEIADLTITAGKIVNATITGAKIANSTITDANITALTITAASIAAATITAAKMVVGTITAASGIIADINADTITSGSIRAINVAASSYVTQGSYLTTAAAGADVTLNVKNTADFAASGSGVIIDTTNDQDAFTYTGKTATTLTGCSGVLAHNNGATIVPLMKTVLIDKAVNALRVFGDRGDGVVEALIDIGSLVGGFPRLVTLGTANSAYTAVKATSTGNAALWGITDSSVGTLGEATTGTGAKGSSSSSGIGVQGTSTSGYGGEFDGNATKGNLLLPDCNGTTFPTSKTTKQLAQVGARLYYSDGSHWLPITQPYFESAEQTLTAGTDTAVAHGLTDGTGAGRLPKLLRSVIRCKTTEFGYAVGDEVTISESVYSGAVNVGVSVYADTTNVGFVVNASGANLFVIKRSATVGTYVQITPANWKFVIYAW